MARKVGQIIARGDRRWSSGSIWAAIWKGQNNDPDYLFRDLTGGGDATDVLQRLVVSSDAGSWFWEFLAKHQEMSASGYC